MRERTVPPRGGGILVAEDDPSLSRLLSMILRETRGCAVTAVSEAAAVVPAARREHPELVLLDRFLCDGDAHGVLAELRAHPETADIPVIVVTASREPGIARSLVAAGAAGVIHKPFDALTLSARIDELLARRVSVCA